MNTSSIANISSKTTYLGAIVVTNKPTNPSKSRVTQGKALCAQFYPGRRRDVPRNQHKVKGTGKGGSARDSKKLVSFSNTGVYNLILSWEEMGIEDQLVLVKPNSPNTKRKKDFPRNMVLRSSIRIAVNFHPIHEEQGEKGDGLIGDTQPYSKRWWRPGTYAKGG